MGGNGANFNINGKKVGNSFKKTVDFKNAAGMKLNGLKELSERALFMKIDSDHNKELSQDEIDAYYNAKLAKINENIAGNIYDDMSGVGIRKSRLKNLNKITKDNVAQIINEYSKVSPDKSLVKDILDEMGISNKEKLELIDEIFNKLLEQAQDSNIDTSQYKKEYESIIRNLNNTTYSAKNTTVNLKDCDRIFITLSKAIESKALLTSDERQRAQNITTTMVTENLQNVATKAKDALDYQHDELDGWAGKTVDWLSQAWASQNRYKLVDDDLNNFQSQINELKKLETDENAFKAKFKEIFGVEYDKELVFAYQNRSEQLKNVEFNHALEQSFNDEMKVLLGKSTLQNESVHVARTSFDTGGDYVTATKEQVFEREYNKLAQFIDTDTLENEFKKANATSIDEKYAVMHEIAKICSDELNANTLKATNGKSYETFTKECDALYDAAFGIKNNVARRVEKYNISQQTGAMILKSGVKIGSAIALSATGVGLVGVAAGSALINATVDISDGLSSGKGLTNDEITKYLINAGIDGTTILAGGGISNILKNATPVMKVAGNIAGNTAVGAAAEYMQTGEITLQGVTFQIAFSSLGAITEIRAISKNNAAANNAAQEVKWSNETMIFDANEYDFPQTLGVKGQYLEATPALDANGNIDFTTFKTKDGKIFKMDDPRLTNEWIAAGHDGKPSLLNRFLGKKESQPTSNPLASDYDPVALAKQKMKKTQASNTNNSTGIKIVDKKSKSGIEIVQKQKGTQSQDGVSTSQAHNNVTNQNSEIILKKNELSQISSKIDEFDKTIKSYQKAIEDLERLKKTPNFKITESIQDNIEFYEKEILKLKLMKNKYTLQKNKLESVIKDIENNSAINGATNIENSFTEQTVHNSTEIEATQNTGRTEGDPTVAERYQESENVPAHQETKATKTSTKTQQEIKDEITGLEQYNTELQREISELQSNLVNKYNTKRMMEKDLQNVIAYGDKSTESKLRKTIEDFDQEIKTLQNKIDGRKQLIEGANKEIDDLKKLIAPDVTEPSQPISKNSMKTQFKRTI